MTDISDARTNRVPERPEDYLSADELAFLADEEAAERDACPTCGGTGRRS